MTRPALAVRCSSLALLPLALATFAATALGSDKPVPTKEAAARMTLPEGFRATLFAGEPDVVQPIAMTFDDRGRLWVVECLSYPKWRADGTGSDRVVILEDTDGDGIHDKRTVFLDNGSNLSGIEVGFGGVWLCSLPNLIFIPVTDGADKPAGPPEVVLDGWNLKDTLHNVFNSLAWGPDGWLYGCNGIQARSKVGKPGTPDKDRVYMDCGVWRYHPTRKVFEAVAHGTTNPFGLDWDDFGQMFITNCVIDHLWHVVPGGHYQRMYGQDANPYVFGLMGPASDHKHWGGGHWTTARADEKTGALQKEHSDAGGGHAHAGCAVYLGDNFPAEYRNSVFMCNIHGNRVNRDTLHRTEDGYVGKHAPDFLNANDPWFRGICVKYGPDGGLYVTDWTDTGECHNYDVADVTNGRIYKVTFGTPRPWAGDLSKLPDAELVKLQLHKNDWFVRKARRLLHERATAGTLDPGTADALRAILNGNPDPTRKLRALWALHVTGGLTAADRVALLGHADESVRAWAVLLAGEDARPAAGVTDRLVDLARSEPSEFVRLHIASVMQRLPHEDRLAVARGLFSRPAGNPDPNLALMAWYGIQPSVAIDPAAALALAAEAKIARVREYLVRHVLTLPSGDLTAALGNVVKLFDRLPDDPARRDVLRGIRDAVADRRGVKPPPGWAELYPKLDASRDREVRTLAETVALAFGDARVLAALRDRAADPTAAAADRRRAVQLLVGRKVPDLAPVLRGLLADPAVRGAAIRGLAAYPDAENPAAILKHYHSFTAEEKADAVQTLASRPAFALALLDAIEEGAVPKTDVTAFAARQIQALNNQRVSDRLAKVWGTVRPASATRAAQAEKYKKLLTPGALKSADLSRGRALYAQHCASCHKLFGEGGDVGPELTGSQRADLDYILENVLDPSAVVPGEYRMTAFTLLDGRTITGIVRKETPQAVTIRTVNDEVTVQAVDIDARKQTALSIMPDGLFDVLKEDEVRDLVAYLASPAQVPLPPDGGP
jgi:putative membrane-bound dehydrogenase-like protein